MKKPPGAFIVDHCAALLNSLEATLKSHDFPLECYNSAAQLIAKQDTGQVGCVLVNPLVLAGSVTDGDSRTQLKVKGPALARTHRRKRVGSGHFSRVSVWEKMFLASPCLGP